MRVAGALGLGLALVACASGSGTGATVTRTFLLTEPGNVTVEAVVTATTTDANAFGAALAATEPSGAAFNTKDGDQHTLPSVCGSDFSTPHVSGHLAVYAGKHFPPSFCQELIRTGTSTPTPTADLQAAKSSYESAATTLGSYATSFAVLAKQAVQAGRSQDLIQACLAFLGAMRDYDSSVAAIAFPTSISDKAHVAFNSIKTLEADLLAAGSVPPDAWAAQWNTDIASAQTTHDAFTQALGVPNDTFLPKI